MIDDTKSRDFVPCSAVFAFFVLLPAIRRRRCKVTSKNEWHYLALTGNSGKGSSANSPWSERTSLGPKSPIFRALCRSNPHGSGALHPRNRDENAHPTARDVSRGGPHRQERVQPDRAPWLILEYLVLSPGNRSASKALQSCRDLAAIWTTRRNEYRGTNDQ